MAETNERMQKHYAKENSDSQSVKCKCCGKVSLNCDPIRNLKFHSYDEQDITVDEHLERDKPKFLNPDKCNLNETETSSSVSTHPKDI